MPYVRPEDVKSPKSRWYLFEVVVPGEAEECAYALGEWDGERVIGFRWNGTDENPLGSPQSRGIATWMVLDKRLSKAVIENLMDPKKQEIARGFLGLKCDEVF